MDSHTTTMVARKADLSILVPATAYTKSGPPLANSPWVMPATYVMMRVNQVARAASVCA